MMRALLFAFLAVAACSSTSAGSAENFPADAYATGTTDSGKYKVEIRTAPTQPPSPGTLSVDLAVFDAATNAPVPGLGVDVVPWMPAMGHGTSVTPTVTEKGGGHYVADDVSLFMQGDWQLRLTFTKAADDHATIPIEVP